VAETVPDREGFGVTLLRAEWDRVVLALSMRAEYDPRLFPIREAVLAQISREAIELAPTPAPPPTPPPGIPGRKKWMWT
jgi:hypothetical protein